MTATLYIDIETLPDLDMTEVDRLALADYKPPEPRSVPSGWKDKVKIAAWAEKEKARYQAACSDAVTQHKAAADKVWRSGSLDWRIGRIACIGVAVDDGPVVVFGDGDEHAALDGFAEHIRGNVHPSDLPYLKVCAHNVAFDATWIFWRALLHGETGIASMMPHTKWDKRAICTMEIAKGLDWKGKGYGLAALAGFLGIGEKGGGIDGSQVYNVWTSGKEGRADVRDYCRQDVELCRELHRVLQMAGV